MALYWQVSTRSNISLRCSGDVSSWKTSSISLLSQSSWRDGKEKKKKRAKEIINIYCFHLIWSISDFWGITSFDIRECCHLEMKSLLLEMYFTDTCVAWPLKNALMEIYHLQGSVVKKISLISDKNLKLISKVQDVFRCPLGVFLLQLFNHSTPVTSIFWKTCDFLKDVITITMWIDIMPNTYSRLDIKCCLGCNKVNI